MSKKKTAKVKEKSVEDGVKLAELAQSDEYQRYLKDHARRLRQLERQANGFNMVEPE